MSPQMWVFTDQFQGPRDLDKYKSSEWLLITVNTEYAVIIKKIDFVKDVWNDEISK